jgi:hypothetical protein
VFPTYNNIIVNNVSTHEGGGVSINDAPLVIFYNNTVMKNMTTATAMTSTGIPAPAGLSTSPNSALLQATLPGSYPTYSNPVLFNNIFWDNRAGSWDGTGVYGLGLDGDPGPIHNWDMGVTDPAYYLAPTYSIIQSAQGISTSAHPSNRMNVDPLVRTMYDTSVQVLAWRTNPNFVGVNLVAVDAPPILMGDYHIQPLASPAVNAGVLTTGGFIAPNLDIDGDTRPSAGGIEIGADEVGPLSGLLVVIPGAAYDVANKAWLPAIGR